MSSRLFAARMPTGLGMAVLALAAFVMSSAAGERAAPKPRGAPTTDPPDAELLANLDFLRETDLKRDGAMLSRLRMLEWSRAARNMKLLDSQAPLSPADSEVK